MTYKELVSLVSADLSRTVRGKLRFFLRYTIPIVARYMLRDLRKH